jgi:hypothetical protein
VDSRKAVVEAVVCSFVGMLGIAGSEQVVLLAAAAAAGLVELVDAVVLLVGLDLAGVDLAVAVPVDIVVAAAPAEAGQERVVDPLNKEVVRSGWNSLVASFLCCLLVLDFCLFSKYLYFMKWRWARILG